jgi:hypothetical protein
MLCFSRVLVNLVPFTSLSRCRSADTTALTLYTDGVSDHSVLKDSSPKPYCPHLRDRWMNRCSTVGSSGAEALVLTRLRLDSNEASDRPTVSPLRSSVHPALLTLLLLLCNSSDDVKLIPASAQCTKCSDACANGTAGSSDGVFFLPFLRVFNFSLLQLNMPSFLL